MKKVYLRLIISSLIVLNIGDVSLLMAGEVDIHGFISQGYLKSDKNNYLAGTDDGTFQFNEMGINFTTYATRRLKIGCQFFARDLGDVGNDEIVVNWAFAEYNFKNWLGFRSGLLKGPFGFYNDTRDYDSLRTEILLPGSVYNELFRDGNNSAKGIEFFGTQSIGPMGMVKYQLLTVDTQIPDDSGTVKIVALSNPNITNITNIDVGHVYIAYFQWFPPLDGLRLAGTCYTLDYKFDALFSGALPVRVDTTSAKWYVVSAEYTWNDLTLSAENYIFDTDVAIHLLSDGMPKIADMDKESKESYFLKLSYRLTDWLEAGYYYSRATPHFSMESGATNKDAEKLEDNCLSFRFDINPSWLVKLEAHLMNGEYGVGPDDDGRTYSEWMLFGAKMTFAF